MKILVTGGLGFIGTHLMKELDNARSYDIQMMQDVRNKGFLKSFMMDVDVVVHLAAQTSIAHSWDEPDVLYTHNIDGAANVAEVAAEQGVKRIIHASSASVYSPYENPYSFSKYVQEGIFKIRQDKVPTLCFRLMNVYGKGQNLAYGTVIPAFSVGMKKGEIGVYGDGEQTRDFIHVDDVVKMLVNAIYFDYPKDFPRFETMDLGTGEGTSVNEIASIFAGLMNKKTYVRKELPARKEIRHSVADLKKIEKVFGFKPTISIKDGVRRVVEEGI